MHALPSVGNGTAFAGSFWHVVGICRIELGELDEFHDDLRLPDDHIFLP